MAREGSLKKNFFMNSLYSVSSFLFPLITFPYISRVLGPEGTGKVSFAISLITYFSMFAQLGIPSYGIRVCARVRDNKEELTRTTHELLMINWVMCLLSYLCFFVLLFHVPRLWEERILFLSVSSVILLNSLGMEWLYQALEQYTYITVRSLVFKAVALVAMFLLIRQEKDYVIYGAVSIFASSASNLLNLLNAHKYIGFKPVGGYRWKRHLRPVLVFFAMACATTLYTYLDEVMLGFMTSDVDVGYYHAATRIKKILVSIITSLGTVLLPRASYYVEQGRLTDFKKITGKSMRFIFLVAVPTAVYFILFAKQGIELLSGDRFGGALLPMKILMPTLVLIGITNVLGIQILVPTGRETCLLYSELSGAFVDMVLNAILIPVFKATGAAIGTLCAETAVLLVQCYFMKGEAKQLFHGIPFKKVLAGVGAGLFLCLWILRMGWSPFFSLASSAVLFFGGYVGTLLLTREELTWELYWQISGKIRNVFLRH